MSLIRALPGSKFFVGLAAIGLTVISLALAGTFQPSKADAAGFVFPSLGAGCSINGVGTKTLLLRASARSFFTNITKVIVNVDGGAAEYDSGAISTTNFGPVNVPVVAAVGPHTIVMTVSSTGNPDETKTGTATVTATSCSVHTS